MKIALIGPAFPYRGGIAHHQNMLYLHLIEKGHEVDVITFSRQYPKFLYPGQFQEEGSDGGGFAGQIRSERMIDTMNPLSWIRTGRELRRRGYDLLLFRFWLPLFGLPFGVIARLAHHRLRRDILVLLDNLIPHEHRFGDEALTKLLFRYCNFAITQSSIVKKQLKEMFPAIPQVMLPHPIYENFGNAIPVDQARRELGITSPKVILFFGFIRKYKGLDRLLAAMPRIIEKVPDLHLLVVGEFFDDAEPYMQQIREGGVERNVTIHNAYVANDEVARWFSAADLLVLPYHSASNSGIVQIGYNFAMPSIVTDVGSLSEVVIDGKTGYVLKDASPDELAAAVERMYQGETLREFSENIKVERRKYSWEAFVDGMEQFVKRIQQESH